MKTNAHITELLQTVPFDRKSLDSKLSDILANICFEIMNDISTQIYTQKRKGDEYNSYCGVIFSSISESVKLAHRAKTYEDYVTSIESCVLFVRSEIGTLSDKYQSLRDCDEDPELLLDLRKEHKKVYDRFFKKGKKRKVRKNVSKKR